MLSSSNLTTNTGILVNPINAMDLRNWYLTVSAKNKLNQSLVILRIVPDHKLTQPQIDIKIITYHF